MKKQIKVLSGAAFGLLLLTACGNMKQIDGDTAVSAEMAQKTETSAVGEDENQRETVSGEMESDEVKTTDEAQILAVYERMQQAMVDKDTDTLREMMGADTTVRHITGRTQTMDEWLSDVENEEMKYYSIEVTNPEIIIQGGTATLTCSNVIDARIYGSRGTWTLSGGAAFEKIDGEWVMAHSENE